MHVVKVFLIFLSFLLSNVSFGQTIDEQMISAWIVNVQGETRTRVLKITAATPRSESLFSLDAIYGWVDGNQTPITAEVILSGKEMSLNLTTQPGSVIKTVRITPRIFEGTFTGIDGRTKPVTIVRASHEDLQAEVIRLKEDRISYSRKFCKDDPSGALPKFQAGDSWTWAQKDTRTGILERTIKHTVTRVTDTMIEGFDAKGAFGMTPDLMIRRTSRFTTTGEPRPVKFPVTIGETWSYTYGYINGQNEGTQTFKATVVAYEKVTVPAGEFYAYRIEGQGHWLDYTSRVSGSGRTTDWYAPCLKHLVKLHYSDGLNNSVRELVDFRIKH